MIDGFGREWMSDALCREVGEAPFYYPYEAEDEASRRELDLAAKAICGVCRVSEQCLEYALKHKEVYGTWGGYTQSERERLLSQKAS